MTHTRRSSDISMINELHMYDFQMFSLEADPLSLYPTLLISGYKGYTSYLLDVRFRETIFLTCAPTFDYMFWWRLATEEEAARLQPWVSEPQVTVYALEEDISLYHAPLEREARIFFIVARSLDILLSYDEILENRLPLVWRQATDLETA